MDRIRFREELRGHHHGQRDLVLNCYVDTQLAGFVEYAQFNGRPYIDLVAVEPPYRRCGVATALLGQLQSLYPGMGIEPGQFTHEGAALWSSIPKVKSVDPFGSAVRSMLVQLEAKRDALVTLFEETRAQWIVVEPSAAEREALWRQVAGMNFLHDEIDALTEQARDVRDEVLLVVPDTHEIDLTEIDSRLNAPAIHEAQPTLAMGM